MKKNHIGRKEKGRAEPSEGARRLREEKKKKRKKEEIVATGLPTLGPTVALEG